MNAVIIPLTSSRETDLEPRIHDEELASRLGYAKPQAVRQIITANETELCRYGDLPCGSAKGIGTGRKGSAYYLNEPQALLICMRSDAPVAAEIRQQIIETYTRWRKQELEVESKALRQQLALAQLGTCTITAREYMTIRGELWPDFMLQAMQYDTARLAHERTGGVTRKPLRRTGGKIVYHNAYPLALLEEAYERHAFRLN